MKMHYTSESARKAGNHYKTLQPYATTMTRANDISSLFGHLSLPLRFGAMAEVQASAACLDRATEHFW